MSNYTQYPTIIKIFEGTYCLSKYVYQNIYIVMKIRYNHIHGVIMSIAWFWLLHCALWSLRFKHRSFSILFHMLLMIIISLTIVLGSTIQLVRTQFDLNIFGDRYYHNGVGIVGLFILPLLLLTGLRAKYTKINPSANPSTVQRSSLFHKIFGSACIILSRIALYTGWTQFYEYPTICFILGDIISFSGFWYCKIKEKKLSLSINKTKAFREVSSKYQLNIYSGNYFIFKNNIYSTVQVLGNHPGGFKIIDRIKQREVDRFMYGQQSIQDFQSLSVHQHSKNSIELAKQPLAVIKIPCPFREMMYINQVKVSSYIQMHKEVNIFLINLRSINFPFQYGGYQSLSQLGRHYAVTINEQITRLYTQVNFCCQSNIQLMKKLVQIEHLEFYRKFSEQNKQVVSQASINDNIQGKRTEISLLIKHYSNGKFTSKYINQKFLEKNVTWRISQPEGFGLEIKKPNGRYLLLAAGTGIYPFSDLIDLIYKSLLLQQNHQLSSEIVMNNPILNKLSLKELQIELYYSVRNLHEIHPLTALQLNYLMEMNRIRCLICSNQSSQACLQQFKNQYPRIPIVKLVLQDVMQSRIKHCDKVLICTPNRITKKLRKRAEQLQINPGKIKIV